MGIYGQFCPVALAAEVLTRRWTPLVVRELLCGSVRFNELRRGVPRMSPALLSRRLDELEAAGILVRTVDGNGDHPEYHLTRAGRELQPVIEAMGTWGRRWIRGDLQDENLDPDLLMWDMRRRIDRERAPEGRTVVHFVFRDPPRAQTDYWVVVEAEEVDLCIQDPGWGDDLTVRTDLATMTGVWMGHWPFAEALRRGDVQMRGPERLRRAFPGWLGLSLFAGVDRPEATR